MTCASPFAYIVSSEPIVFSNSNLIMAGSVNISSLTLPSTEVCLLGWNPAHFGSCHWNGLSLICPWDAGSHYWYDCSGIPSIEIFPEITLSGSCVMPFQLESYVEIEYVDIGVVPTEVNKIVIADFVCTATIQINYEGSITNESIQFTIPGFDIAESNGSFSATIPLETLTYVYHGPLLTYTISVGVNLLFCLTPIPPVGWINLQFPLNIEISGDGLPATNITSVLLLPIIGEDE
jgi:hypothetical protein